MIATVVGFFSGMQVWACHSWDEGMRKSIGRLLATSRSWGSRAGRSLWNEELP